MKHNNIKGSAILCLAALIWGLAFVAQADAADKIPSFVCNCLRSFIGAAFLFVFLLIRTKRREPFIPKTASDRKTMLKGALICGFFLTVSVNLQQFGLSLYPENAASEARSGFITALYVVIVPILSIFIGKRVKPLIWVTVAVATLGFYLLCLFGNSGGMYLGDLLVLLCALSFSLHILSVDRFVDAIGGIKLSILQFLVCGIFSGLLALIFEFSKINLGNIISAAPQILYLGIMSSGIAYTLQVVGQRYAEPAVASLSMSLESVFAALGGWLISGNSLKASEFIGCSLVFLAIILAQLPEILEKRKQ